MPAKTLEEIVRHKEAITRRNGFHYRALVAWILALRAGTESTGELCIRIYVTDKAQGILAKSFRYETSKACRWRSSSVRSSCNEKSKILSVKNNENKGASINEDTLAQIVEVKQSVGEELLKQPGVTGVDVGYKYVDGKRTDQIAVRVFVEKKKKTVPKGQECTENDRRGENGCD